MPKSVSPLAITSESKSIGLFCRNFATKKKRFQHVSTTGDLLRRRRILNNFFADFSRSLAAGRRREPDQAGDLHGPEASDS